MFRYPLLLDTAAMCVCVCPCVASRDRRPEGFTSAILGGSGAGPCVGGVLSARQRPDVGPNLPRFRDRSEPVRPEDRGSADSPDVGECSAKGSQTILLVCSTIRAWRDATTDQEGEVT